MKCLTCKHARQAGCVLLNRDGEEYTYIAEYGHKVGIFDGVSPQEIRERLFQQ